MGLCPRKFDVAPVNAYNTAEYSDMPTQVLCHLSLHLERWLRMQRANLPAALIGCYFAKSANAINTRFA